MDYSSYLTLFDAEGNEFAISIDDFQRDIKTVRGRDFVSNLYGNTKQETAQNMIREMETTLYYSYDDRRDNRRYSITWLIDTNISNFEGVSPHLREIIALWNSFPCKKSLELLHHEGLDYLEFQLRNPLRGELFEITEEEKLEMLCLMIDYGVYNSNGWRLDGSHRFHDHPAQYTPPNYDE